MENAMTINTVRQTPGSTLALVRAKHAAIRHDLMNLVSWRGQENPEVCGAVIGSPKGKLKQANLNSTKP